MKILLRYSSINKYLIVLQLLLTVGCVRDSDYDILNGILIEEFDFTELTSYEYVIIISDKGDCIQCNRKFAKLMESSIKSQEILIILSCSSSKVDISQYLKANRSNIIIDRHKRFEKSNLYSSSTIFRMGNSEIVEIVEISLANLQEVSSRFNTN